MDINEMMKLAQQGNVSIPARAKLLEEAKAVVCGDRNLNYGNPEDNFRDIANLWTVFKNYSFSPMDVAVMCMLIKVARLKKSPSHHDSVVDIAGYAGCAADIQAADIQASNNSIKASGTVQEGIAQGGLNVR